MFTMGVGDDFGRFGEIQVRSGSLSRQVHKKRALKEEKLEHAGTHIVGGWREEEKYVMAAGWLTCAGRRCRALVHGRTTRRIIQNNRALCTDESAIAHTIRNLHIHKRHSRKSAKERGGTQQKRNTRAAHTRNGHVLFLARPDVEWSGFWIGRVPVLLLAVCARGGGSRRRQIWQPRGRARFALPHQQLHDFTPRRRYSQRK